ncbi:lambda-exonuclease family protein [Streptosporangium sp. NPDC051022]|uniref:YqaJ viral recombinase family nuclease n=1 Tax=Streptosporangium sp. NPDC051022 TaxID=3155752 RepID=UPI0034235A35
MGRYLGRWANNTSEWDAARAHRIGGSRVAALLGLSPWASPYSVWCQMAGLVGKDKQTRPQERGHYLEAGIADWFADQHPEYEIRKAGTYVHQERDYQLANPDRLLLGMPGHFDAPGVRAGLEVKTDADASGWGRPGTDEIPAYYRPQVQWYMDTLGVPVWYVVVLTGRLDFREYVVRYDAEDCAWMRDQAEDFLASLYWREMPELDHHPATYAAVRKLHPQINRDEAYIASLNLAVEYIEATTGLREAQEREQEARTRLLEAMGSAQRAFYDGHRLARRQAKGGGVPFLVAEPNLPDVSNLQGVAA